MKKGVYIIAEAGVNHNGSIEIAKKLVDNALTAGADCVKFQTFTAENLVRKESPKTPYQLNTTPKDESHYEMLKKLELTKKDQIDLFEYCKKKGINFMSTPYSFEDVDFLEKIGIDSFKIASAQLTESPFLSYIARKNKPIFLSTGMSFFSEILIAVEKIRDFFSGELTVMQCTTNYPSRIQDANLNVIHSLRSIPNIKVGYSDHVTNNLACIAAVAMGVTSIEKHFTIDKNMPGPDHSSSLNCDDFKTLVNDIRLVEKSLGLYEKKPNEIEIKNSFAMKRSIVCKKDIKAGQKISNDMLCFKRPSSGLCPSNLEFFIGKTLNKNKKADQNLYYNDVN